MLTATQTPSEEDLMAAIEDAQKNLVDFRGILLSTGPDEVDPAPFHYEWSDLLLNGAQNEAIEGFRESAKGQLVLRAFPLYALRFPSTQRDYIVIIKQNQLLASNKLLELEEEYLNNPALASNIVEVKQKSAKVFSVDVLNAETGETINVRIEAYGKGSSIRGLANVDRRPKIVIIDDPQDLEDSQSDTILEADWQWFISDVKFLGQYTRIFLIGNNLGEKCIVERVFANPKDLKFNTHKVAILKKPKKEGDPDESAWPAKFSLEFILDERESMRRLGLLDVWMRERMCEAISDETRIVTKDDFIRFSTVYFDALKHDTARFITIDPASSENRSSCYRAICVNAVKRDVNGLQQWFLVDFPYGRWPSNKLMDILFEKVVQWTPQAVGIEKGMYKQVIEPFIRQEMQRRNIFFNIVPIEHAKAGSKLERCKMLGPRYKAKSIWHPESAPWLAELEAELTGMTIDGFKSMYTDLVDTLAMQAQIAAAPTHTPSSGQTSSGQQVKVERKDPYQHRTIPHQHGHHNPYA